MEIILQALKWWPSLLYLSIPLFVVMLIMIFIRRHFQKKGFVLPSERLFVLSSEIRKHIMTVSSLTDKLQLRGQTDTEIQNEIHRVRSSVEQLSRLTNELFLLKPEEQITHFTSNTEVLQAPSDEQNMAVSPDRPMTHADIIDTGQEKLLSIATLGDLTSDEGRTGERETILLVEDNEELRTFVSEIFSPHYQVIEAADGAQGLAIAAERLPDLIISDVMMPGVGGLELCHSLKTNERTHHIPVILLTAKSAIVDQVRGLETGADIYIVKPFSPQVLALQVRNLLQHQQILREKSVRRILFDSSDVIIEDANEAFVTELIHITESNMGSPGFNVDKIARQIGMSRPVLYKRLKDATGLSLNEFTKTLRLKKAATFLVSQQYNVNEVAELVGFEDRRYFTREFGRMFGMSPSEYIKSSKKS